MDIGSDSMQMRALCMEDLEQYDKLLRYAFQVTGEDLMRVGWEEDEIKQSKSPVLEKADVLGWFDEGRLVSQIAVYPMQMNIQGRMCEMGFVTGVATYPEYSGKGLVTSLMRECFRLMRENGQYLSLLYPYSIPFYRKKGWELISDKMSFKLKDSQLPVDITAPGRIIRCEPDDAVVLQLHDRFAKTRHGCIKRDALVWEEYWRWDADDISVAVYHNEADEPAGYLVYLIKEDVMRIKELVCMDYECWCGLWEFISAHHSMVEEVVGDNYYSQPIAYWLPDSDIREVVRPYIMGRIIDVAAFLRQYRFKPGVAGAVGAADTQGAQGTQGARFTLRVHDPLLEWNEGDFALCVAADGAVASVERVEAGVKAGAEADTLELSIGTLTTLLMGYQPATRLHTIGRLAGSEAAAARLEALIYPRKPYISEDI